MKIKSFTLSALIGLIIYPTLGQACTSLLYKDANGNPYAGRTMELPMELPYEITYFPIGNNFHSLVKGKSELNYASKHAFVSVTVPDPVSKDLKVVEGMNDAGLSFSVLAFASTDGPRDMVEKTTAALAAIDLGAWTLSSFENVAEVKAALQKEPVLVTALLPFGLLKTPFHYTLHDASGASIVVEFANGKQNLIENPVGVMTNGPEFQWHITNLNNYTFFSNIDKNKLTINGLHLQQPDSGIATVALPASNTSVGRFVRAVYYSNFAEKSKTPEAAVKTLSHVMNNFDRPRGITVDERFKDGAANIAAPGITSDPLYISEYTSWTALSDLKEKKFYIRSYAALNYIEFDLKQLQKSKIKKTVDLKNIASNGSSGTLLLQ